MDVTWDDPIIIGGGYLTNEFKYRYFLKGSNTLFKDHVENGKTVEMTRVYSLEEVDAHNEFYYDIVTGTVTMALATFSEIAVVNDTDNGWNDRSF